MPEDRTSVQVTNETWKRLTMRKEPGDTYDDVISELLDTVDQLEATDEE